MRVFVAGATGAIGRPLIAVLRAQGHDVVAATRSPAKADLLRAQGVEAVQVDAFDSAALHRTIQAAEPAVVVHQLTALSQPLEPGRYGEWLAQTNRLRRDVTPVIVDAARAARARRVVAQSVAFMVAPRPDATLDERAPLYLHAPPPLADTVRANADLETAVLSADGVEGVVLRYGFFYGPGTAYAPDGQIAAAIRRGEYPVVGSGAGRFPFVHVDDAAQATLRALDHGDPGVYNIVDDEPAPMHEWVLFVAELLGAPLPPTVSAQAALQREGPQAVYYGTQLPGASNAKAKRLLGFAPTYRSWRDGFRVTLPAEAAA